MLLYNISNNVHIKNSSTSFLDSDYYRCKSSEQLEGSQELGSRCRICYRKWAVIWNITKQCSAQTF